MGISENMKKYWLRYIHPDWINFEELTVSAFGLAKFVGLNLELPADFLVPDNERLIVAANHKIYGLASSSVGDGVAIGEDAVIVCRQLVMSALEELQEKCVVKIGKRFLPPVRGTIFQSSSILTELRNQDGTINRNGKSINELVNVMFSTERHPTRKLESFCFRYIRLLEL